VTDDARPGSVTSPIIREIPWSRRLAPRPGVAFVVVDYRDNYQVLWPHESQRVLPYRRPLTVYEVDLAQHRAVIVADLPSRNHEDSFHADIKVRWRVVDPAAVVRHRLYDAERAISEDLLKRARNIARQFSLGEAVAAEEEINAHLSDVIKPGRHQPTTQPVADSHSLGTKYGLSAQAAVQLSVNAAAIEQKETSPKRRRVRDTAKSFMRSEAA
jgi:hypothetical protein